MTIEGGYITYSYNDRVYRISSRENSTAENISQALEGLSPLPSGGEDCCLNISPDGNWYVLQTERFDAECEGWACLAVVKSWGGENLIAKTHIFGSVFGLIAD